MAKSTWSKAAIKAAELEKVSAIAVPGDNYAYAIINVPRSFANKRCWVLTQTAFDELRNKNKK